MDDLHGITESREQGVGNREEKATARVQKITALCCFARGEGGTKLDAEREESRVTGEG